MFKWIYTLLSTIPLIGCGDSVQDIYNVGINAYSNKNYQEAEKWMRQAAEQGHIDGQTIYGTMHLFGYGVKQNREKAEYWLMKSATAGNRDAQSIIGMMYYNGMGAPRDMPKAVKWLTVAADNGDKEAKRMLSIVFEQQSNGKTRSEM